MHHSERWCAHFCSEWCIVGYRTGALWDLWIRLIGLSPVSGSWYLPLGVLQWIWGGGYYTNFTNQCSVIFLIFHHSQNTGHLLNTAFIFDRCQWSLAAVTHFKYGSHSKNLIGIFATSNISLKYKWRHRTFVTPAPHTPHPHPHPKPHTPTPSPTPTPSATCCKINSLEHRTKTKCLM